jgi:hypothetical protein
MYKELSGLKDCGTGSESCLMTGFGISSVKPYHFTAEYLHNKGNRIKTMEEKN